MNLHDPKIPVLGQPYKVFATHFCIGVECQCEGKGQMILFGQGASQVCPSCKSMWVFAGLQVQPNGSFGVQLQKVSPQEFAAMQGQPPGGNTPS